MSGKILRVVCLAHLIIFSSFITYTSQSVSCSDTVQTFICLPSNYSSMDIPLPDQANLIKIEIHISDILVINDRDFSITYSLYFNVQWWDPRIHVNNDFLIKNKVPEPDGLIPVNLNLINDLWVPNVFIYNLKSFQVIDVLSRLAGLWVTPNKDILYSQASQITFICPMVFDYFPLDTQECKFQVGSYSYNMEKMVFQVAQLGYAHKSRTIVLDYDIEVSPLDEADKVFDGGTLGNYSLAGFKMTLTRHVSHYIITYYLPSGLFVVVSWISFLVPADVIPGRMALLVTLFLVLVNIFNNVTTNTPKAEGLTAIECWMLACILFVFAALAEYAALLFHKSKLPAKNRNKSSQMLHTSETYSEDGDNNGLTSGDGYTGNNLKMRTMEGAGGCPGVAGGCSGGSVTHTNQNCDSTERVDMLSPMRKKSLTVNELDMKRRRLYVKTDRFFLVTFPIMFLVFNAVYWYTYLQYAAN